jgi:hypothetical protein
MSATSPINITLLGFVKIISGKDNYSGTEEKCRNSSNIFATSPLERHAWSELGPGFLTLGKGPVTHLQEVKWTSEPVWIYTEKLTRKCIPSPDHPSPSDQLYQLRYPSLPVVVVAAAAAVVIRS